MKRIIIVSIIMLALCFILTTPVSGITYANKNILEIDNCYNVTVKYTQTDGNITGLTFPNCKNIYNTTWNCDCRNTIGTYTLVMSSDATILKKARKYDFTIDYMVYDISEESKNFNVKDYGYDIDVSGIQTTDLGRVVEYIDVPVYINQTVYKDKIINRTVEVIKEVQVDNPVTINRLNGDITELRNNNTALDDSNKHLKSTNKWLWIILIVFTLMMAWLAYLAW
jgi:hypothetical protein